MLGVLTGESIVPVVVITSLKVLESAVVVDSTGLMHHISLMVDGRY